MNRIFSRAIRGVTLIAVIILAAFEAAAAEPSGIEASLSQKTRPLRFAWGASSVEE